MDNELAILIPKRIVTVRGVKAMLDEDLAEFYGIETGRLNEQVKRNAKRFPPDFMFQLTKEENKELISQSAISKVVDYQTNMGGRRKLPNAFTFKGVSMLSGVLHTDKAIEVHIKIIRIFAELVMKEPEAQNPIEYLLEKDGYNDVRFEAIFDALNEIQNKDRVPIGFQLIGGKG